MKLNIKTTNKIKRKEVLSHLSNYCVKHSEETENFLKEETVFTDFNGNTIKTLKHNDVGIIKSTLTVMLDSKKRVYTSNMIARVDTSMAHCNKEEVFGWDDIVVLSNGFTAFELLKKQTKVLPRQKNLSQFVKDFLIYDKRIVTNYDNVEAHSTINFDQNYFDNYYQHLEPFLDKFSTNFIKAGISNGSFYKSPISRREGNYWLPGLNSGIPMTPKPDPIHELVFRVHDLVHFSIPDVLPDFSSQMDEKIYVITRMLSEAVTMFIADVWFVDKMKKRGVDYDFSTRKIYPVTKNWKLETLKDFKQGIKKFVYYIFTGDDTYLLDENGNNSLEVKSFKSIYDTFFVSDYLWTKRNHQNMKEKEYLRKWSKDTKKQRNELNILTTGELSDLLKFNINNDFDIIDKYLNYILDKVFTKKSFENTSFDRYKLGNLALLYKYDFVNEIHNLKRDYNHNTYLYAVEWLYANNFITEDEKDLYKEFFPIFDPNYVSYNAKKLKLSLKQYLSTIG